MTWTVALQALTVLLGAAVLLLASWRLIPRHPDNERVILLEAEVHAIRLELADLTDKYASAAGRAAGRASGDARRARAEPAPAIPRKEQLRRGLQAQAGIET